MIHYSLPPWWSACGHLGESIQGLIVALFPSDRLMPLVLIHRCTSGGSVRSSCSCTVSLPLGCRERGMPAVRAGPLGGGWCPGQQRGERVLKRKNWGWGVSWWQMSITLTSHGTWGKDRIVPREICPENLDLEENKASEFFSVGANVWSGAPWTQEAWFSLRILTWFFSLNVYLTSLTPIEMAAIKKHRR